MADARLIRLRFKGSCAHCATTLEPGASGWWDRETKSVRCEACGAAASSSDERARELDSIEKGVAGASARRKYERLSQRREDRVRANHPRLGGFLLAVSEAPQSITAWKQGAEGEERVGAHLDRLTETGAVVLHDRRVPGSVANVDHLFVARSGVWVIDAKRYRGQVKRRHRGGSFRADVRLYVGGRDCSKLVEAMHQQVAIVSRALQDATNVPVHPVLCFTEAEWSLFAEPFTIDGVLVTWPKELTKRIAKANGHGVPVPGLAARLANGLSPR
jgi:Nuclease-related domain